MFFHYWKDIIGTAVLIIIIIIESVVCSTVIYPALKYLKTFLDLDRLMIYVQN